MNGGSGGYAGIRELYEGYMGGVCGVVAAEENDYNGGHDQPLIYLPGCVSEL